MTVPTTTAAIARHAVPLAEIVRGDTVESVHLGHVAVVDAAGRLLYSAGDPHAQVFTRSTLKPMQALPFVRAGGLERFGLTLPQTALLCASHSGEPRHVAAATAILTHAGCNASQLLCGSHLPYYYDATHTFPPPPPYSPLAHNCSGKHSGMLACCALHGWQAADYVDIGHPLQQAIRAAVARTCGVDEAAMAVGIDGCSAPNFAMPLAALAHGYARLGTAAVDSADADTAALAQLAAAMRAHPEMVSGEQRSDLAFAMAGGGDWIAKAGAEGVQAMAVTSRGLGIAIKVADGQARSLPTVTAAILQQLGLIDTVVPAAIARYVQPDLTNLRGLVVGRTRAAVQLAASPASGAPPVARALN